MALEWVLAGYASALTARRPLPAETLAENDAGAQTPWEWGAVMPAQERRLGAGCSLPKVGLPGSRAPETLF